ncbi:unnamed protein product [Porites lobata]|uniref:Uncharacterized protein n=1 Tax=Porites lobata TaxID=104759 RepID=A0ABN8P3S8_9CNID|nr:unnamed protein product [Porites lobata]
MAASSVNCEAAFLNFYAEFGRNRFGKTPQGLTNLLRTAGRKPGEIAERMLHRIYSRLYKIMWHGCKIGRGQFTGGQPTFVFPECVKKVVCTIIQEDVRDYKDPVGPHKYQTSLKSREDDDSSLKAVRTVFEPSSELVNLFNDRLSITFTNDAH